MPPRSREIVWLGMVAWASALRGEDVSRDAARPAVVLTAEAQQVHAAGFVIDGHNDLPWQLHKRVAGQLEKIDLRVLQSELNTDLPRLQAGGVGAVFWSAYVPASTARDGSALQRTLEQIDLVHRLIAAYPDKLELARTPEDVVRIRAAGRIASMIGIEGGHSIEGSLATLRRLFELGARYMTLTHSDTLPWADSATDDPQHGGLTEFGQEVVREMNRLGMLVDISHVSAETMHDVLDVTLAPVIASHSSAYAVAPHPRNVPDDVLRRVAANGGVVMINFFSGYVVPEGARALAELTNRRRELKAKLGDGATLRGLIEAALADGKLPAGTIHHVVDHIEHVIRVAGVDHVGLGSDFDGVTKLPAQLEDVSCFPLITQELLNRGHSAETIHKLQGENLMRVWRAAEWVARGMADKRSAAR